jgi:hypothetical protein
MQLWVQLSKVVLAAVHNWQQCTVPCLLLVCQEVQCYSHVGLDNQPTAMHL